MIFLYICVALCSQFYFLLPDGQTYMKGVNGRNVGTTKNKEEADIMEIRYTNETNKYTNIFVVNKQLWWDIASNRTNLHFWKMKTPGEKQYFQLVYLPNNEVGIVNANGMCVEYKTASNMFRREPCNFLKKVTQRFKIEKVNKEDPNSMDMLSLKSEVDNLKRDKEKLATKLAAVETERENDARTTIQHTLETMDCKEKPRVYLRRTVVQKPVAIKK